MNKQISEELAKQIMTEVNSKDDEQRDIEDLEIKINNITYGFKIIEDSNWQNDGKYDLKSTISQLVSYDDNYKIIEEFDTYFEQSSSRTGSYYTDYYYSYDKIERLQRVEKVIPEHIEVVWEKYE
jgi:hypothetical protein